MCYEAVEARTARPLNLEPYKDNVRAITVQSVVPSDITDKITNLCRIYFPFPIIMDESISNFRVVGWYFFIFFFKIYKTFL